MAPHAINWHRPLPPNGLRARYLRWRRHGFAEDRIIEPEPEYEYDEYDHEPRDSIRWNDATFDRLFASLSQRIESATQLNPIPLPATVRTTCRTANNAGADDPLDVRPVVERIAEHLERLSNVDTEGLLNEYDLTEDIRHIRERIEPQLGTTFDGRPYSPRVTTVALLLFRPLWLRSPRSWRPPANASSRRLLASLIEHVFARFSYPRFLQSAWASAHEQLDVRLLAWTVTLAQGGSLRRLHALVFVEDEWCEGFGPLPKKLPARLHEVPANLHPVDAVMYAEILRLGGSPVELRRLRLDVSFRVDPTKHAPDRGDRTFWESTVRWLVRHREALDVLDDEAIERLLRWAQHRHTERHAEPFSWSGRSPQAALTEARLYHRQLHTRHRGLCWSSRGWDHDMVCDDVEWTIHELTTSEALADESYAMAHCVRMYDLQCRSGHSAIFSVRCEGERRLTVEVHPATRRVVQIAGQYNRRATADEQALIARWHRTAVVD